MLFRSPFLQDAIDSVTGDRLRVFEPSEAVARQTRRVLERAGLLASPGRNGVTTLYSTQSAVTLQAIARCLLGLELTTHDARWRGPTLLATAARADAAL